jgi:hypothetical protein
MVATPSNSLNYVPADMYNIGPKVAVIAVNVYDKDANSKGQENKGVEGGNIKIYNNCNLKHNFLFFSRFQVCTPVKLDALQQDSKDITLHALRKATIA